MDDDTAEATQSFTASADICQQLLTRYARSSAGQHRHLCATAAATRSIIESSSLPLTPISYFAATITSLSDPKSLDSNALGALTSFISIVLPLVGRREINPEKAGESIRVLAATVEDSGANLGTSGVRAVVKCVGILVAEFCNLKEWDSVSLGFEWLVKFSLDRRPKVRKCAQDCHLTVFKSFKSSAVIKKASKSIYLLLKDYMPLGVELSALEVADGAKREPVAKAEHQDFLQLLNLIKHVAPHLSPKLRRKMLAQLSNILSSKFTVVTRHLFDVISAIVATSGAEIDITNAEDILRPLVSYISQGKKNPVDSVLFAANLAKTALRELSDGDINECTAYFPMLTESLTGFLSSGDDVAAQTSTILRELIDQHIDAKSLLAIESQEIGDMITDNAEFKAIQITCTALHNVLSVSSQTLSEHFFSVVSFLFLKLVVMSETFMKHILLKLADLVNASPSGASEIKRLKDCIGYAVAAMGPEKLLALLPISINTEDFSCSNTWLIPILEKNISGSSLRFFMEHVVPLAKSFEKGSHKVKKSVTGKDLQAHAHGCWGLLPAFCRQPIDTYKTFGALAKLLIPFLKKDSFMLGSIAIGLQELVNENKSALASDEGLVKVTDVHKKGSLDEFAVSLKKRRVYTRKMAGKNIKSLASGASELLQALTDVFFESPPEIREHLKGAIGCLLSISDASVAKQLFIDSLKKFQLVDYFDVHVHGEVDSNTDGLANEKDIGETDSKRCLILDLASCMVEGSDNDLVNMLFYVVKRSLQASEEVGKMEAYHTLGSILEKHSWFCSSQFDVVMDVLTGMKPSANITLLKRRLTCLQTLLIHGLMQTLDDEYTKAFLILNEIILTLKDSNEENRKAAYEALDGLSSKLRSSSNASYEGLYHKLLNMLRGYLSGSSPQIKSGVVSALSVLLYNDPDICITAPEIVPAVMELLHTKAVEVIKAVLGFVKVLVSCLKPDEVRRFLPDIMDGIIRWSSVSRHHFKTKIIVILEILMRKCGPAAVKVLVPDKYKEFVQGVVVNRHGKTNNNKEDGSKDDTKPETSDSSLRGLQNRKRDKSAMSSNEEGSERPWKRKRDNNKKENEGGKFSGRGARSDHGEPNRPPAKQHKERTTDMNNNNNNRGNIRGPAVASKFSKHKKVGQKEKKSAA
ncbi:hypothetical protein CASFOL_025467 [Castilleja foliolosa]|uniref:Ribosomal RNA-processing protein 12-like conserved domain-containing protein n=1 Tax=Castilleja foliolosa TaxID=1961234 RepID=A0ABD3CR75_9LAMI